MGPKTCPDCIGTGKDLLDSEKDCPFCGGSGWVPDTDDDDCTGDDGDY